MSGPGEHQRLDERQRLVVDHTDATLIYLGAPGTGTTTALAHAIAQRTLVEGARSVWAVTVGRRAAIDLRSQVAGLLGSGALPTVTTIHALAFSILATFGPRVSEDLAGIRVLSGAEEDLRIRELIAGTVTESTISWPQSLHDALPTLGLANEVRAFIARLREQGIDPQVVADRARSVDDSLLAALAQFAAMEAQTATLENVVDYPGLLSLALAVAASHEVGRELHGLVRALYVDEFHDFDALQAALVNRIAAPEATFVIAGDPARSIFRFRGAHPRVLADLIESRSHPITQKQPQILIADRVHRANAQCLDIAARVLRREITEGLPTEVITQLRRPVDAVDANPDARIEIVTADSAADLQAHVGRILRQAHLDDGVAWSDMAVLARTTATVSSVRRSLEAAGVPAHVSAVDLALPDEPAVGALLSFVDAAVHSQRLTDALVEDLMSGPIVAADPEESRILARQWRSALRIAHPDRVATRFATLQREALVAITRGEPDAIPEQVRELPAAQRLCKVGRLLADVAESASQGAPPAQVLWQVWSGSLPDSRLLEWPERLRRAALAGHRASGHDIDAVLALFATAERLTERYRGVFGVGAFVTAIRDQRVPAEAISQRGAIEPEAVTVLTAHHAKGRSWHTVVVVDLEEGTWPITTVRRGLLDVDGLVESISGSQSTSVRDLVSESSLALDADRRLLYTALTRAHHRTLVAAVASPTESGSQPSRFIADLQQGEPAIAQEHLAGRPVRPLTLTGHVAALRTRLLAAVGDERERIVTELATLARLVDDDGHPLVPAADPTSWWHARGPTSSDIPLRTPDEPLRLSASALRSITTCPLNWFLDRHVRAGTIGGSAAALGIAVHALAEALVSGELPADPEVLDAQLEVIWPHLGFDVPWFEVVERTRVRDMLSRLCAFHRQHESTHTVVGVETQLAGVINLDDLAAIVIAGRGGDVRDETAEAIAEVLAELTELDRVIGISGRIDRIEMDDEGQLSLLDVKTTAQAPTRADVTADLQLALYQAAVLTGALAQPLEYPEGWQPRQPPRIDHSALLMVGIEGKKGSGDPKLMSQPALTEHGDPVWLFAAIADAISTIRRAQFSPRPGHHCRSCAFTAVCPTKDSAKEVS